MVHDSIPAQRGACDGPGHMSFELEQRAALHLLQTIENGVAAPSEVARLIDEADPALVYLVLTWLRDRYSGDHPAAEGVIGRLVELSSKHASIKSKMREGQDDPISKWFEEVHSYRAFDAQQFIELIVEKLVG
jgi:hypothetical protein